MGGGGFEEMEAIFGEVKAAETEWSKPFVYHVHGGLPNDRSALVIRVTDFHSNTWQALKSKSHLEDMRDMIGIGGSWSDFVEYVIASLKSEDIQLSLEGQSKSGGAAYAKLNAQKAKGMPRIPISLTKVVDEEASEAMANISLGLSKALKKTRNLLINEQERCCQVTKILAAEQEKSQTMQWQLDNAQLSKRQKIFNQSTTDVSQDSSDKQSTNVVSSKVPTRVVPAYRRAKVRGVLLQDTEDED